MDITDLKSNGVRLSFDDMSMRLVHPRLGEASIEPSLHREFADSWLRERQPISLTVALILQAVSFVWFESGSLSRYVNYDTLLRFEDVPRLRPDEVSFVLTKTCNLRCLHCYNDSGMPHPNELATTEKTSLIDSLGKWGVPVVTITGGEPTLDRSLKTVLDLAASHGIGIKLSTSGWFVPDHVLTAISRGVIFQINLSVDGADAPSHDFLRGQPGAFERMRKSLVLFSKSGLKQLVINAAIHPRSLYEMSQVAEMAVEYGATAVSFKALTYSGRPSMGSEGVCLSPTELLVFQRTRDELRRRFDGRLVVDGKLIADTVPETLLEQVKCNAGQSAMFIDADGAMLPCETLMPCDTSHWPETTPASTWVASELFKAFRRSVTPSSHCGSSGCPGFQYRNIIPVNALRAGGSARTV